MCAYKVFVYEMFAYEVFVYEPAGSVCLPTPLR